MLALTDRPSDHATRAREAPRAAAGNGPRVAAAVAWLALWVAAYLLAVPLAGRAVERLLPDDGWPDLVALLGPP